MDKLNANKMTAEDIKEAIELKLTRYFGISPDEADEEQIYKATILTVKDILTSKRSVFHDRIKKTHPKRVYYMCMEFLVGRQLKNNLMNLGLADEYREALSSLGCDLDKIYEMEPDPGLGNGGLGRLAACFMDSLTTLGYAATGFSICYEYGLFRQRIIDGNQVELPDNWMTRGDSWLVPRTDKAFDVKLGGNVHESWDNGKCSVTYDNYETVRAVPYDMMISGADTEAVSVLRLWKAVDTTNFNMNLFSQGQYVKAIEETSNAEVISKVLYPSDDHEEGKLLRLTQQYFLVGVIAEHYRRPSRGLRHTRKLRRKGRDPHKRHPSRALRSRANAYPYGCVLVFVGERVVCGHESRVVYKPHRPSRGSRKMERGFVPP